MPAVQIDGGPQTLVRERRRHPDVDDSHIRTFVLDRPSQGVGFADGGCDDESPVDQQLNEAVAENDRVLGDDDS